MIKTTWHSIYMYTFQRRATATTIWSILEYPQRSVNTWILNYTVPISILLISSKMLRNWFPLIISCNCNLFLDLIKFGHILNGWLYKWANYYYSTGTDSIGSKVPPNSLDKFGWRLLIWHLTEPWIRYPIVNGPEAFWQSWYRFHLIVSFFSFSCLRFSVFSIKKTMWNKRIKRELIFVVVSVVIVEKITEFLYQTNKGTFNRSLEDKQETSSGRCTRKLLGQTDKW